MATYPWVVPWQRQKQDLPDFPHLHRWFEEVRRRPATVRAYARGDPYLNQPQVSEADTKLLFGQAVASVDARSSKMRQ
jgi:GST-like protein